MSLLILLLGMLSHIAPLVGIQHTEPVAESVVLPAYELELEACCEQAPEGRAAERLESAVRSCCEWSGLRVVQLRREGKRIQLRVENGALSSMDEYEGVMRGLEGILNSGISLQLLRVHPDSDTLVMDGEVQELLKEYEAAVVQHEEDACGDEPAPALPELPRHLRVIDYMLAEFPVLSPEDGNARFEYLVVQRPEAAAEDEMLVTEQDVDRAELDPVCICVDFTFTPHGSATLSRLTRSMKHGKERLAIMLNGVVVSAPIVHAVLGSHCFVSGMNLEQCRAVVDDLSMLLPVPVRVVSCCRVEQASR